MNHDKIINLHNGMDDKRMGSDKILNLDPGMGDKGSKTMSLNEFCTIDSCDGFCGDSPNWDCWCDAKCVSQGDCCHDAEKLCSGVWTFLSHIYLIFATLFL